MTGLGGCRARRGVVVVVVSPQRENAASSADHAEGEQVTAAERAGGGAIGAASDRSGCGLLSWFRRGSVVPSITEIVGLAAGGGERHAVLAGHLLNAIQVGRPGFLSRSANSDSSAADSKPTRRSWHRARSRACH